MLFNNILDSFFLIANVLSVSYSQFFTEGFWLLFPDMLLVAFIFYHLIIFTEKKKNPATDFYKLLEILLVIFLILISYIFYNFGNLPVVNFGHLYLVTDFVLVSKAFVTLLTILVLWISKDKITVHGSYFFNCIAEFSIIISFSLLFIFILLSSTDLLCMFLAIEGLSASLYALCAMMHLSITSSESAVKYFSLGAIASGLLLYGIVCLYGLVGDIDFDQLQYYFSNPYIIGENSQILQISLTFIIFGFLFKIAAFPGHVWVADVYEGIWKPTAAFFSIVIKVALVLFLFRFIFDVLYNVRYLVQPILGVSGIASMFVGTLGALQQTKIIRFIAYASINQVGYLLLGMASCSLLGLCSSLLFIFIYAIMSLVFFRIILNIERSSNKMSLTYLSQLMHYSWQDRKSGICLSIVMLSMGGLPPLGGFVSKYLIYEAMYQAHLEYLFIFSLLISVVTVSYYLDFVKLTWFRGGNIDCGFIYRKDSVFTVSLTFFLVFFIFFFSNIFENIFEVALHCLQSSFI